jgi:phosphate-selective porin OprO/OprP
MKIRLLATAILACTAAPDAAAHDFLGDWPVKTRTEAGYEFGFKGLYQYDLNAFSGDTSNPQTGAELFSDANAWRRKEFGAYGKTPWGLDFQLGYDFTVAGGTSAGWVDNFVRYTSPAAGAFRIGQFKTPVGWDEAGTSSSATTFMERALPVQAASAGRRIGVDWMYAGLPGWILYAAYFNGGDLNGDNDGHGPAARLAWAPVNQQPDGAAADSRVLHLGIAASREQREGTTDGRGVYTPPSARFRARPEANLRGTRLVDTGALAEPGTIDRLGFEAAWIRGPLLLQAEYLSFGASPAGRPDFTGTGNYVAGSWVLTGESRPYRNGAIGNVRPARPHGAFELAVRYSAVDLDDGPVRGGRQQDWTLGANWYVGQHLKLQANHVWANSTKAYGGSTGADVQIDPRIFEMRAQVSF